MFKKLINLGKPYKKNFIFMAFFITLSGLLTGIFPYLSGWIVDDIVVGGNKEALKLAIFYIGALFLASGGTQYLFIYHGGKVETGITFLMREKGFDKLQKLSLSYYDKNSTGQTVSKLSGDIRTITRVLSWNCADLIFGTSSIIVLSILMLSTNLKLGLMVMGVMPLIYIGGFYIQGVIFKKYKKVRKINGEITSSFNESILGFLTIKSFNREDECIIEFTDKSEKMRRVSTRAGAFSGLFDPYIMVLGGIASTIVIFFGGSSVINNLGLTYGTFLAFFLYGIQYYVPMYRISSAFINIQNARASAKRYFDILEAQEDIQDGTNIDSSGQIYGDIEFVDVDFSYNPNEPILKDFSLKINKGENIALVGETGGGKSTIVNLACRFYEPTKGRILIDGEDYTQISQERLHSSLGYVLQTPYLFDDTIFENIRYGNLGVSDNEIIEACKSVNAHSFIMKLKDGYNTRVGENGRVLSGGQRQLLALARAVIANPSIFVLDEATASVDTETEKLIQEAINKVLSGRTSFIIAHRLTTIVNADRILVIKGGKIIEEGSHLELLDMRGEYFNLYIKQFYGEKEAILLG